MRILLAMNNLKTTGGMTVGLGLVEGFGELVTDDEYFILHPDNSDYQNLMNKTSLHSIPVSNRMECLKYKLYLEQIVIPKIVRKQKIDVLLTCTSMGAWNPGCFHISLIQLPYLAYYLSELDFHKPLKLRLQDKAWSQYFRMTRKHLQALIVQTPVMKQRMIERWAFKREQVYVVPPAAIPISTTQSRPRTELPEPLKSTHKTRPYICYIAGPILHKNFEILPETWAYLSEKNFDCDIVLTIPPGHSLVRRMMDKADKLGVAKKFICLGNVPHNQVMILLQHSLCLVMPTLLETLGLPYIEAMHCKCPITSSDRDFARSVCGPAAVYFDPKNPVSVGEAILKMTVPEFRKKLINAGQMQMRETFSSSSWCDIARSYANILKQVVKN